MAPHTGTKFPRAHAVAFGHAPLARVTACAFGSGECAPAWAVGCGRSGVPGGSPAGWRARGRVCLRVPGPRDFNGPRASVQAWAVAPLPWERKCSPTRAPPAGLSGPNAAQQGAARSGAGAPHGLLALSGVSVSETSPAQAHALCHLREARARDVLSAGPPTRHAARWAPSAGPSLLSSLALSNRESSPNSEAVKTHEPPQRR